MKKKCICFKQRFKETVLGRRKRTITGCGGKKPESRRDKEICSMASEGKLNHLCFYL